jgi:hypothetical protein
MSTASIADTDISFSRPRAANYSTFCEYIVRTGYNVFLEEHRISLVYWKKGKPAIDSTKDLKMFMMFLLVWLRENQDVLLQDQYYKGCNNKVLQESKWARLQEWERRLDTKNQNTRLAFSNQFLKQSLVLQMDEDLMAFLRKDSPQTVTGHPGFARTEGVELVSPTFTNCPSYASMSYEDPIRPQPQPQTSIPFAAGYAGNHAVRDVVFPVVSNGHSPAGIPVYGGHPAGIPWGLICPQPQTHAGTPYGRPQPPAQMVAANLAIACARYQRIRSALSNARAGSGTSRRVSLPSPATVSSPDFVSSQDSGGTTQE